jgi:hypothetical protein
MFTFASPSWDARKGVYTIQISTDYTLQSDSQCIDLSGNTTIESPDTNSVSFQAFVKEFAAALIAKDTESHWFSSRLRESSLVKRLLNTWNVIDSVKPESEWFFPVWRPTRLEISTQGFVIEWSLVSFVKTNPKIAERFLPPMSRPDSPTDGTTDIRRLTIQTSAEELEQVNDIPFTDEHRMHDFHQQQQDKSAVQEAKLRLALAKLKAQRLANTYYEKYGEIPTDEENSEDDSNESS